MFRFARKIIDELKALRALFGPLALDVAQIKRHVATLKRLEDYQTQLSEAQMATLDEALGAMRASNDKTDSLIIYTKSIQKQLADVLSGVTLPPDVQAKVDAIFNEANAQAAETTAAIEANTGPQPEPSAAR